MDRRTQNSQPEAETPPHSPIGNRPADDFLGGPVYFQPQGLKAGELTRDKMQLMESCLQQFIASLAAVEKQIPGGGDLDFHPWYGVRKAEEDPINIGYLPAALELWQKSLVELGRCLFGFANSNKTPAITLLEMNQLNELARELAQLPALDGKEIWEYLGGLKGERLGQAQTWLDKFEELLALEKQLEGHVLPWELMDLDAAHRHVKAGLLLSQHLKPELRIIDVIDTLRPCKDLLTQLKAAEPVFTCLREAFGSTGEAFFSLSAGGLAEIVKLQELIALLPSKYWRLRDPCVDSEAFEDALKQLRDAVESLEPARSALEPVFLLDHVPPLDAVRELQATLLRTANLGMVSREWRNARNALAELAATPNVSLNTLTEKLPDLIRYLSARQALLDNQELREALGPIFQGADTDLHAAASIRAWYIAIRREYGAGFGPRVALGDCITSMSRELADSIRQMTRHHAVPLTRTWEQVRAIQAIAAEDHPLAGPDGPLLDAQTGLAGFAAAIEKALAMLPSLTEDQRVQVSQLHQRIDAHRSLNRGYAKWQRFRSENELFTALALDIDSVSGASELSKARSTLNLAETLAKLSAPEIARAILQNRSPAHYKGVQDFGRRLLQLLETERRHRDAFVDLGDLEVDAWFPRNRSIKALHTRNKLALLQEELLADWVSFRHAWQEMHALGLDALTEALARKELPADQAPAALKQGIQDLLASEVLFEGKA